MPEPSVYQQNIGQSIMFPPQRIVKPPLPQVKATLASVRPNYVKEAGFMRLLHALLKSSSSNVVIVAVFSQHGHFYLLVS